MKTTRTPQVLAALALAAASTCARAQPPEQAAGGEPMPPGLAPLALEAWVAERGGLTTLSLKMENATADEIAAEVRRQTGLDIEAGVPRPAPGEEPPRYSVEATGAPFRQAVREWNRGENKLFAIGARMSTSSWLLSPFDPRPERGRRFRAGPLEITASRISHSRRARLVLGGPQPGGRAVAGESAGMSIEATARADPRLQRWVAAVRCEVEEARDDKGRDLTPRERLGTVGSVEGWPPLQIPLRAPEAGARRIARLRGVALLAVAARTQKWEIDLAATPRAQRTFETEGGEVTVRFEGIGGPIEGSPVALWRVSGARGEPVRAPRGHERFGRVEFEQHALLRMAVRVVDEGGRSVESGGFFSRHERPTGAEPIEMAMEAGSRPARVLVEWPVAWREVRVPFEIKDIPLP